MNRKPEWRPFGASNLPDTCAWCGQELREQERAEENADYHDDLFCGLRCGYQFGVRMAGKGRRFIPGSQNKEGTDATV
jgi:hypothetical protein